MADAVRRAIREHGPLTFAQYMELALYGRGGFYGRSPVGVGGDFLTSPHTHPVFGELLGRALRELWEALGRPEPMRIAEVGAGDGTLARQLLAWFRDIPVSYVAVEVDATARQALAEIDGVSLATELPEGRHLVLANELLDNLPFRVLRGENEVRIGLDGDRLVASEVAIDDGLAALVVDIPKGQTGDVVVPVGALAFVDRLAATLSPAGYALLIDYGDAGPSGSVHGYRGHRIVADVLAAPGSTDITAGVDFGSLATRARDGGLQAFPLVTQHGALMALGLEAWLRDELSRQHGELDAREGAAAVRTWSGRSRATSLADPGGLGRFRWWLLATPGLPAPAWHRDAAELDARG